MKQNADKILVGKIVAPQGLRGEVRVQTFTESPLDFKNLEVQSDAFSSGDFKFIRQLNPSSEMIIASIYGVDDRNAAEKLRSVELFINRSDLPDLPSGKYYHTDLIGMKFENSKVVAVQNFGAGDILELNDGRMIPFAKVDVDVTAQTITIKK